MSMEFDLPSHLHTLPSFETPSKLVNLPNMNDFDIDDNIINIVNSKYHSLDEINKIKLPRQNFSIFHTNIRSLSKHFDLLHTQLSTINIPFESKQQLGKSFLVNVDIKGYSPYTQPTKSSCGGCAIYVNFQLDHHVRNDLSVLEDDFETIWVETNNHKSETFFCCCLYRHRSSDITNFFITWV